MRLVFLLAQQQELDRDVRRVSIDGTLQANHSTSPARSQLEPWNTLGQEYSPQQVSSALTGAIAAVKSGGVDGLQRWKEAHPEMDGKKIKAYFPPDGKFFNESYRASVPLWTEFCSLVETMGISCAGARMAQVRACE